MKKVLYLLSLVTLLSLAPVVANAQKGSGGGSGDGSAAGSGSGQGNGDQIRVQDPTTHEDGTPVGGQGNQVQNQVSTQNQGEESQLKVNTQSNEASGSGLGSGARQQMGNVSHAVEDFLSTGNKSGGIGKQAGDIAEQQKGAQNQIGKALDEMESKKGLAKKLFGPDYGAIKDMKKLMQENQVRIQQLKQLQNQTQNQAEETQLHEMIQAMVEQNTSLQSQVQSEEGVKSVFGWLVKLFN